jgi:purine-nucleoside phosphorylase
MSEMQKLLEARDAVKRMMGGFIPLISLTLGSGLGYLVDLLEDAHFCEYSKIPGCPVPGATGHAGKLWWGMLSGVPVIMLQGRKHLYEGVSVHDVVFTTRLVIMLGVEKLIITHATGAVTRNLQPKDIVAVWSQIAANCPDPTSGFEIFRPNPENQDDLGVEFSPIDPVFNSRFLEIARECALEEKVALRRGVSHFKFGRTYESWAEGEAMARAGADVGTMSTIPEVMAAVQMGIGLKPHSGVLDLALVTDMVANVRDQKESVSHGEVLSVAEAMKEQFGRLIVAIVQKLGQ